MQKVFKYSPSIDEFDINIKNIYQTTSGDWDYISNIFESDLDKLLVEAKNILKPKCGFIHISSVKSNNINSELLIDDVTFNLDKIIFSYLKNISGVILFVGTTGKEFETWLEAVKQKNDPLKEYISNSIGSAAAESIAEWIHNKIIIYLEESKLKSTNRYSPGFCGWSVSEQHKLFSFFPEKFCEIKIIDSGMMLPIKSVSGIIGVGENIKMHDYPCEVCKIPHCYKNRIIKS